VAKRCLIVTFYFPPTGGGGVQRITKLVKYLSRQEWQFHIITSAASGNLPSDTILLNEIPETVQIDRIPVSSKTREKAPLPFFKSTFFMRWISSLIFIPDRYKKWIASAKNEILECLQRENYDLVLISTPPYSLAVLAAELTETIHIPVVLDMRDPWTTNPYKIYPTAWHLKKDRQLERETLEHIQYGVSAYASLIEFYKRNIENFNPDNWRHITNGFDEEDFKQLTPVALDNQQFNIAFSGTFYSHINNPRLLFKAINDLHADLKGKIKFHHIGSSHISLKKMAAAFNLSANIIEWGYHSHKECLNILAGMDAFCFILDSTEAKSNFTVGGKVYEYLRLGKPILALVPPGGEAADLINKNKAGIVVDPHDTEGIKKVLSGWLNDFPQPGKNSNFSEYERARLAEKYSEFFNRIINRH